MISRQLDRRRLMTALLAASLSPWQRLLAGDELLQVTPSDAEGPFYPVELPADSDNDLLRVVGMLDAAPGQVAYVHGSVVDREGTPIDGARVEIWQVLTIRVSTTIRALQAIPTHASRDSAQWQPTVPVVITFVRCDRCPICSGPRTSTTASLPRASSA